MHPQKRTCIDTRTEVLIRSLKYFDLFSGEDY